MERAKYSAITVASQWQPQDSEYFFSCLLGQVTETFVVSFVLSALS